MPSEMKAMAVKELNVSMKSKESKARGLSREGEHILVTRDGNIIKGPIFEKMIQTLVR